MLSRLIDKLVTANENRRPDLATPGVEQVVALLLIEIARADHDIDEVELSSIRQALSEAFSLADRELDEIIADAMDDATSSVSLHRHVKVLNDRCDKALKISLIENMWRIAYADGDLDRYEEYTIRKLSDLLYLRHRDFMQAKLRVLDEFSSSS